MSIHGRNRGISFIYPDNGTTFWPSRLGMDEAARDEIRMQVRVNAYRAIIASGDLSQFALRWPRIRKMSPMSSDC